MAQTKFEKNYRKNLSVAPGVLYRLWITESFVFDSHKPPPNPFHRLMLGWFFGWRFELVE